VVVDDALQLVNCCDGCNMTALMDVAGWVCHAVWCLEVEL